MKNSHSNVGPAAPDQAEGPRGILTGDELAAIRKRAWDCDDDERKRRGKWPRSTRCHQGMGKAAADLYAETEAERKRLTAELSRLRSSAACNTVDSNELGGSLAERQGAEPPTGSKTREIL